MSMAGVQTTAALEGEAASKREAEAAEEDEDVKSSSSDEAMRPIPSYPFPAEFHLEFSGGARIEAIRHLCQQHPGGTRTIAIFFPGVHGGVGPCRQPGQNFDEHALYATVAEQLVARPDAGVDCYRCSWPFMRPRMAYAVGAACRMLHHALLEVARGCKEGDALREDGCRNIQVFFVGHSLGGAVTVRAAETVARHFGADGSGGQQIPGLESVSVHLRGICTLNGAMDVSSVLSLEPLARSSALLICGDADEVVPPQSTMQLHEALPSNDKRLLVLPGGSHDLFTFKEQLVSELTTFILTGASGQSQQEPSEGLTGGL